MSATKAPKLGRPPLPESERATVTVYVRLRPADAEALTRTAVEAGQEPAVWAREAVLARLKRRR